MSTAAASAVSFAFGDSPALADALLALVIAGKKTATCGALRDFGADGEPLPMSAVAMSFSMAEADRPPSSRRSPSRGTGSATSPEAFALAEGEGDFAAWRQGHIAYFERNGGWSADLNSSASVSSWSTCWSASHESNCARPDLPRCHSCCGDRTLLPRRQQRELDQRLRSEPVTRVRPARPFRLVRVLDQHGDRRVERSHHRQPRALHRWRQIQHP